MIYQMLASPIVSHMVAMVGSQQSSKTKGTRIWGDFRDLKNNMSGIHQSPLWAAKLSNPDLIANYHRLWQNQDEKQDLANFWRAGRRVSALSMSADGWSMLLDMGPQGSFPESFRFERGEAIYLIAFCPMTGLCFEYGAFSQAVKLMQQDQERSGPLQQLFGKEPGQFGNCLHALGWVD